MSDTLDMIIIGAGLSGIGAACRYVTEFPDGNFAVLESRDTIGGTWDLFRYPGIRSDSDMLTLGYDFRPWPGVKTLAAGPAIRDYVRDTAREYGVDQHIQYHSQVVSMDFDTQSDVWNLTIVDSRDGSERVLQSRFVLSCAGYYRYDTGHDPDFNGRSDFKGDIIHPQFWPEDYDYAGKRVAVIGSGATAVTLVPELAKTAEHVTQVQRTPTYVASVPSEDVILKFTSKILPSKLSFRFNRWKNIAISSYFYRKAQKNPDKAKRTIRKRTLKALGPDYDVDTHFNPPYNPWDQRFCMVPDGDMFQAIKRGDASIVTGHIDRFVEGGIQMQDGTIVPADLIVTATGLEVKFGGGMDLNIDGEPQDISKSYGFKGLMFSGLPNLVSVFGYTNASWTLRADLMSRYAVRMLRYLQDNDLTRVVAVAPEGMSRQPWTDFQAGYLTRVMDQLPSQGDRMPWLNIQDYKHDQKILIDDPIPGQGLEFSRSTDLALETDLARESEAAE